MATIRPFRGLRYGGSAGPLGDLVAPPYDVLSAEERDAFAAKSPHNVVHLTLPEQKSDDRSKFVKYARSAAALQRWRDEGALELEPKPAFYRYTQEFDVPGTNRRAKRLSLIATIKVEPYDKGVVLPHEQTFPKHKEDRLRILEATRSHLECIYGLFEDDDQAVFKMIQAAPGAVVEDVTTEDGVHHLVERIDDPAWTKRIAEAVEPKKVWIADGHHRYETACTFREMAGEKSGVVAEDFMMMALSSISDPGLELLPTHRILDNVTLDSDEIRAKLEAAFPHRTLANTDLVAELDRLGKSGQRAFGVAFPDGQGIVLHFDDPSAFADSSPGESARLSELDVTILHRRIFDRILGLQGLDFFSYTRDPHEALDAVEHGAKASFLMNPPTVDDMRQIALGGEKMPQKSTYYYPKILSGLVLWSLNDFVP